MTLTNSEWTIVFQKNENFHLNVAYKCHKETEACANRLCSQTFTVGFILEPREGWIVTSSMLTPHQTNRPKRAFTSMCMEVTYKCRLLGLSLLLALADFAHM